MIYYVYMLKSKSVKPVTYVGYTNNIVKRIGLHNSGKELNLPEVENGHLFIKKNLNQKKKQFLENII